MKPSRGKSEIVAIAKAVRGCIAKVDDLQIKDEEGNRKRDDDVERGIEEIFGDLLDPSRKDEQVDEIIAFLEQIDQSNVDDDLWIAFAVLLRQADATKEEYNLLLTKEHMEKTQVKEYKKTGNIFDRAFLKPLETVLTSLDTLLNNKVIKFVCDIPRKLMLKILPKMVLRWLEIGIIAGVINISTRILFSRTTKLAALLTAGASGVGLGTMGSSAMMYFLSMAYNGTISFVSGVYNLVILPVIGTAVDFLASIGVGELAILILSAPWAHLFAGALLGPMAARWGIGLLRKGVRLCRKKLGNAKL